MNKETINKSVLLALVVGISLLFLTMIQPFLLAIFMAALFAAALWLNLATWIGAPVSTTHAIVGGVMGSGIAASKATTSTARRSATTWAAATTKAAPKL